MLEDPVFTQKCLLLSFENRDELSSEEYKQLKSLGFSYRGRNAWPTFHRYEPGFVPGPVRKAADLRFFATCVEQAIEVASAVQSDPDQLFPADQRLFLTRVPEPSSNGQALNWSSQWLEPQPIVVEETASIFIDEFQQARLRKLPCPPPQNHSGNSDYPICLQRLVIRNAPTSHRLSSSLSQPPA